MINPIYNYRLLEGLTQQELADKVNVSVGTIANIENYGSCSVKTAHKLGKVMGIEPAELLRQLEGWMDWKKSERG